MPEALDLLAEEGIALDTCRVRAFPFTSAVESFVESHDVVFVVEQNRDGQLRSLVTNELGTTPAKLVPLCYYAGLSISAEFIRNGVSEYYSANKLPRLSEVSS